MEIRIKKISTRVLTGNASGVINTYKVVEDDREFLLTRVSRMHGSSLSIEGKEGILYRDSDDNKVHRQVVALSGACGLNTDDEVIKELSPWVLRGVIMADEKNESGEITIISRGSGDSPDQPMVFIDGKVSDLIL